MENREYSALCVDGIAHDPMGPLQCCPVGFEELWTHHDGDELCLSKTFVEFRDDVRACWNVPNIEENFDISRVVERFRLQPCSQFLDPSLVGAVVTEENIATTGSLLAQCKD